MGIFTRFLNRLYGIPNDTKPAARQEVKLGTSTTVPAKKTAKKSTAKKTTKGKK